MSANTQSPAPPSRRSILDLTHDEARSFLLKAESYCSLDLPPYIDFAGLIAGVDRVLHGKKLADLSKSKPRDHEDVNYTILHNKDGRYAWRPFQLIHPALYVSLVHAITEGDKWKLIRERFKEFADIDKIRCLSLPMVSASNQKDRAEQVSHWWHEVEQRSIEMSLDYDYLIETDITDCYGAIYTHSIAWALHGKSEAKQNRRDQSLIGNVIDAHIRDMRHSQTNGIPQGSVLMDFVAEMVLGFADLKLYDRLRADEITDYRILRYRDDYRVFVNSPHVGEAIVKLITEVTADLGLKLSPIRRKFTQIPNTGHMQIWLQRVTFPLDRDINYEETVCRLVAGNVTRLWNNDWISSADLVDAVNAGKIVNTKIRDEIAPVVPMAEVELFRSGAAEGYY